MARVLATPVGSLIRPPQLVDYLGELETGLPVDQGAYAPRAPNDHVGQAEGAGRRQGAHAAPGVKGYAGVSAGTVSPKNATALSARMRR
jgi:hypothetical protein